MLVHYSYTLLQFLLSNISSQKQSLCNIQLTFLLKLCRSTPLQEEAKAPFTLPIQGRFTVPICCALPFCIKRHHTSFGDLLTASHHPHITTGKWICDYNPLSSCCRCASTVFMSKHVTVYPPVMFWQQCTSDMSVIHHVGRHLKHHAATCLWKTLECL